MDSVWAGEAGRAVDWPLHSASAADMPQGAPPELAAVLRARTAPELDRAWGSFVSRVTPLLLHVCRSLGGGHDAAMDRYARVVEGLRESDFQRLRAFVARPDARFTTWLVVVARRLCLEHERRRLGRTRTDRPAGDKLEIRFRRRLALGLATDADVTTVAGSDDADPSKGLEGDERLAALLATVAQLAPKDRLLLQLRFEADYTAAEIARALDLSTPFHVYRRLRTVLATLRTALRARGIEPG
jgi:RNA polymerase sigma factor (sigma-70 family)